MRILNAEALGYSDAARAVLQEVGEIVEGSLTREQIISQISAFDVLIVRLANQVDREIIDAGKRLKVIVTATTGLDHVDVEYARSKDVAVLSLQGEVGFLRTITATPEHTWALLLALVRHIPAAFASVRAGDWDRDAFRGHELDGKRLGLLGLGRVGARVAGYGLAFGMKVSAFDPFVDDWVVGVERHFTLPDLLSISDVLSVHVPLNAETIGLIGKAELALLPEGALLINTSRGEVVKARALVEALETGILAGAALDFLPSERDAIERQASSLLAYARQHDNLLITPHLAGATYESMAKTELFMAHKLKSFLQSFEVDFS